MWQATEQLASAPSGSLPAIVAHDCVASSLTQLWGHSTHLNSHAFAQTNANALTSPHFKKLLEQLKYFRTQKLRHPRHHLATTHRTASLSCGGSKAQTKPSPTSQYFRTISERSFGKTDAERTLHHPLFRWERAPSDNTRVKIVSDLVRRASDGNVRNMPRLPIELPNCASIAPPTLEQIGCPQKHPIGEVAQHIKFSTTYWQVASERRDHEIHKTGYTTPMAAWLWHNARTS